MLSRPHSLLWSTLIGAAIALLAVFLLRPAPLAASIQDGKQLQNSSGFRTKKSTSSFAALGYTPSNSQNKILAAAKDLKALQLIPSVNGSEFWLELFYGNGDYTLVKVKNLTFYRRYANWRVSKVQTRLSGRSEIAFPILD
ncbi:MAG: hypothetical protein CSA62_09805 [Planctomycetota bacterium]|nr:MAG: hypothetical protein CSA62_09805 [Planctomycetota bacterium]